MKHSISVPHSLIILDVDGTILDTPHFTAWHLASSSLFRTSEALSSSGLSFEEYMSEIAGRPRRVGAERVLQLAGLAATGPAIEQLAARKQEIFSGLSCETKVFPDASRFLDRCAPLVSLAICTASQNAETILERKIGQLSSDVPLRNMLNSFRLAKDRVGVRSRALLLGEIAKQHGVTPGEVVVIDDSIDGVREGISIGMYGVWLDRTATVGSKETSISTLDDLSLSTGNAGNFRGVGPDSS